MPPPPVPRATSTTSSTPIQPSGPASARSASGARVPSKPSMPRASTSSRDRSVATTACPVKLSTACRPVVRSGGTTITPPSGGGKRSAAAASTISRSSSVTAGRPRSRAGGTGGSAPRSARSSTWSGGPDSSTRPSCRKQTRSATSRAKPISWVASTIVIPPAARSRMADSTSPTSSGSRAEVISSSSSTSGSLTSDRASATRCCWPPDSCSGYFDACSARPSRSSTSVARRSASRPRHLLGLAGAERHVVEHPHVGEQVERLEHDADAAPHRVGVGAAAGDLHAVEQDAAAVDRLEQVDAAQQGRLAGAARADEAHDLVLVDGEVDAVEHDLRAVGLVSRSTCELGDGRGHTATCVRRARSRFGEVVDEAQQREREGQEQHGGRDVGRVVERPRRDDLGLAHRLPHPEHADQGDVLLQADDRVHQRGDHVADGLREDGVAQGLPLGEADRPGRRALALGHRVDAAAEDLGGVRASTRGSAR